MSNAVLTSELPSFFHAFKGEFHGVLRWPQLDALWAKVLEDRAGGWYLYAVGEEPPSRVGTGAELEAFIREVDLLLRREHDEDYCGIVYADNLQQPGFIKIFDPNHLGSTCGSSGKLTLPGWVICKVRPENLQASTPLPNNRRRWWGKLSAMAGRRA